MISDTEWDTAMDNLETDDKDLSQKTKLTTVKALHFLVLM